MLRSRCDQWSKQKHGKVGAGQTGRVSYQFGQKLGSGCERSDATSGRSDNERRSVTPGHYGKCELRVHTLVAEEVYACSCRPTFGVVKLQAKTVAEQLAAKLNTRLNYQPKEEEEKEEEEEMETFQKFEEELEINDFPQQARWRVTSKVRNVMFS